MYAELFAIDWSSVISSCNNNVQSLYGALIQHLVIDHTVPLKSPNIYPKRLPQIRMLPVLIEKKKLYPLCKLNSSAKEDYNTISKNYDQAVTHWYNKIENSICENPIRPNYMAVLIASSKPTSLFLT